MLRRILQAIGLSGFISSVLLAEPALALQSVPAKNVVELTPKNFCTGLQSLLTKVVQDIQTEAGVLCAAGNPTRTLTDILANPYLGQGNPASFITEISPARQVSGQNIQIYIAYAMKVPAKAVKALLGEETHVKTGYKAGILSIQAGFVQPPRNMGDADTAFGVEQKTIVNRTLPPAVQFTDVTTHDLKMYPLYPNNFDFFLAARTLTKASEQFSRSVVLRGIMADANDPKSTYVMTVLNFIMNSRGDPNGPVGSGMRDTFMQFIQDDMGVIYREQSGK